MRLLMAVSADGFVARGPDDDMSWTGPHDKAAFRLLTHVGTAPLAVGMKTFRLMPPLRGRRLLPLSRSPENGVTLTQAHEEYPDCWLLGGQEVALQAIAYGYVGEVFLCHSPRRLYSGVRAERALLNFENNHAWVTLGGVEVEVRR